MTAPPSPPSLSTLISAKSVLFIQCKRHSVFMQPTTKFDAKFAEEVGEKIFTALQLFNCHETVLSAITCSSNFEKISHKRHLTSAGKMCIKLEDILARAEGGNSTNLSDICRNTERIVRVFVLYVPFIWICSSVFIIFACLWDRQKLHGWLVMGMAGSFTLRSSAAAMRDLAIHLVQWNIIVEAPTFCIFLGEVEETTVFRYYRGQVHNLLHSCNCYKVSCITGRTSALFLGRSCWPLTCGIGCKCVLIDSIVVSQAVIGAHVGFQEAICKGADQGSGDSALCFLSRFRIRHSHRKCCGGQRDRMGVVKSPISYSWISKLMSCLNFCSASDHAKRPNYRRICMVQPSTYFLYMGIPYIILLMPNLVLLGHTWFQLWRIAKTIGAAGQDSGIDRKARLWVADIDYCISRVPLFPAARNTFDLCITQDEAERESIRPYGRPLCHWLHFPLCWSLWAERILQGANAGFM